jgi:hypothetical protein
MCISSLTLCTLAAAVAHGDSVDNVPELHTLPFTPLPLSENIKVDVPKLTSQTVAQAIAPPERFYTESLPSLSVNFREGYIGELARPEVQVEDVVLPSFPVLPIDFVFPAETYIEVNESESSNSPITDNFRQSIETVAPRVQLLRDFLVTDPPLFATPLSGAALTPPAPSPFFPPTAQGPTNDICNIRNVYPVNPRRPTDLQRLDIFCLQTEPGDSRRNIADYGANDGDPYGRSLIVGAIQVSDDPVQTATSVRLQLTQTTQQIRELEQSQEVSLESWASAVEQCLVSRPNLYTVDADGLQRPILFDGRAGRIELNRNGRPFCPR